MAVAVQLDADGADGSPPKTSAEPGVPASSSPVRTLSSRDSDPCSAMAQRRCVAGLRRRCEVKAVAAAPSGLVALGLLLPMEAGVPIPLPADLVMFAVGERVAAGTFPLWLAVAGFEVISVIGTTVLFLGCRGPAHRVIARFGPRFGLTQARVRRAATFVETRGRFALAVGRGTPGLRTLTVVAAGASGLSWRRALPALILGSSVFLQLHLVLGLSSRR